MASLNYYRFLARYLSLVAFKRRTIGGTAERMAARRGDAPCVLFEDEVFSFDEFNRRANRRANLLKAMGVGKGEVVALLMENRPEYLETIVGLGKLGAVAACINTNIRGHALTHSLDISEARRAVVGAECMDCLKEVQPQLAHLQADQVYIDTRWSADTQPPEHSHDLNRLLEGASDANPPQTPLNSKDLLMYIYTSGTTGLPKAARINHYRWYAAGLAMGQYALRVAPGDVVYCPLPLYHSNGILIAFASSLVNGGALALARRFSVTRFWEDVRSFGATAFIYIGEVLRYLVNHPAQPNERDHSVTRILGNGLRPDIWDTFQQRFAVPHIHEFYASTEGNAVTINVDDVPASVGNAVLKLSDNLALVRYDVENEAYLRDERGFCIRCAPGEVGELLGQIKATTPFYGYTREEDTRSKLLHDVFSKGDVFFRTGDLLKQDEQGYYYFIDRVGDTFRWKGENVSTQEVSEILTMHPDVHFVTVYGVKVPEAEGRVGMAALTLEEGKRFDPAEFSRFVTDNLPHYSRPAFLRIRPDLEMTGTYKIRKTELKQVGYDPEQTEDDIYFWDPHDGVYKRLTMEQYRRVENGEVSY